jgi:hypothetical protein
MKFKYRLPNNWVDRVSNLEEFANGATKVTVRLKNGGVVNDVLISDGTYIIATRGFKDLPFHVDEITDIFQSADDKNPRERGGWEYWDDWTSK